MSSAGDESPEGSSSLALVRRAPERPRQQLPTRRRRKVRAPMPRLLIKGQRLDDGGYEMLFRVGEICIGANGDEAVDALASAAALAHELSDTMAKHPELAALMPPQAVAALKAIRLASMAAQSGQLQQVAKLAPTAARVVTSVLRSIL